MSTASIGFESIRFGSTGFESTGFGDETPVIRPRLRLTKRGRAVLLFLAAAPLVIAAVFFALNGGAASASLEGSGASFPYVTVDAGQSLWQVAQEIAPNADPRDVIEQIIQLNQLDSAEVFAGVQLAVPTQYAE